MAFLLGIAVGVAYMKSTAPPVQQEEPGKSMAKSKAAEQGNPPDGLRNRKGNPPSPEKIREQ